VEPHLGHRCGGDELTGVSPTRREQARDMQAEMLADLAAANSATEITCNDGKGTVMPIPSLEMDDLTAALGGTPEDAAKAFMASASKGLMSVFTNAVVDALSSTVAGLGGPEGEIPDWVKLVKGINIVGIWECPPGTPLQTVSTSAIAVPQGTKIDQQQAGGGALGSFDLYAGASAGAGGAWQVNGGAVFHF
jgi:hypothetical protein